MTGARTLLVVALVLILQAVMVNGSSREEALLLKTLFENYSINARPVENFSQPLDVGLDLALHQLFDVNERDQYVHTSAWLRIKWYDNDLQWNPADYNGLSLISIPVNSIWRPDICLWNNAGDSFTLNTDNMVKINSSGYVSWYTPATFKSSCSIDVTYFPFDTQHCPMKFGSWSFNGFEINVFNLTPGGDLKNYVRNGEWLLLDVPVVRHVITYSCCPEPYIDLTYNIHIQRLPLYYTYNLVYPAVLITALALLGFYLPPESGEKISLGVTVLLAMTVFLLVISESMPPTSEVVPLIGQLFGATIVLLGMSTAMTVFVLNLHFRGSHHNGVPRWLRFIILLVSKPMCMYKEVKPVFSKRKSAKPSTKENKSDVLLTTKAGDSNNATPNHDVERDDEGNLEEIHSSEWKAVAMVIDRLFLWMFLITTIIVYSAILTNHP